MRDWKFHHLGIPTSDVKPDETYHEIGSYKFYCTPFGANPYRVQWLRYPENCGLPEILQKVPHLAFKVDDIDEEINGKKVILGPYYPLEGFKVAIIEDEGIPIEFIQTDIDDDSLAEMDRDINYGES